MRWSLKSPASRLFTQPFIRAQIKENINAPRHWPLYRGEFTGAGEFPAQMTSNAENFPFDLVTMTGSTKKHKRAHILWFVILYIVWNWLDWVDSWEPGFQQSLFQSTLSLWHASYPFWIMGCSHTSTTWFYPPPPPPPPPGEWQRHTGNNVSDYICTR